jgi:mannose-6-phosphate isomerase-like protein (cupin superfamily)
MLNARDEVVLVRDDESINLGRRDEACEEMLRFLSGLGIVDRAAAVAECN